MTADLERSSPTVLVRHVTSATDCVPVRPLAVAHARYERSAVTVPADWADRVAGLIAAGRFDLVVASVDGEVVGYATVTTDVDTWSAEPYAHLECLFVAEGRRDRGVGRLLVDTVVEHVRSRGFGELQWQTPAWNEDAIRFYRRLGAVGSAKERFSLAVSGG